MSEQPSKPLLPTLLAFSLTLFLLSGCGWQLRAEPSLTALDAVEVRGAAFDMRQRISRELVRQDVLVHEHAPMLLLLSNERWIRRTIAVDAQGREAATELRYRVAWQLNHEDGQSLSTKQFIEVIRAFNYDPTNTAAAADEEQLTRELMYQDAAEQLLRQLDAAVIALPERH